MPSPAVAFRTAPTILAVASAGPSLPRSLPNHLLMPLYEIGDYGVPDELLVDATPRPKSTLSGVVGCFSHGSGQALKCLLYPLYSLLDLLHHIAHTPTEAHYGRGEKEADERAR